MTRAEAYSSGWHEGRRWAEEDARNGVHAEPDRADAIGGEIHRAIVFGEARGYRDTMARYEAGTLTWEMFEQAPMRGDMKR